MQFKGLDLNLLVVLDALLTEKSITRAAERIHLSQSATSGALARLRDYFGDELLVQIGHKMVPTPRAEGLVEAVRNMLIQAEEIINKSPVFTPETSTRRFRLMMSDYVAAVLMPSALSRIQQSARGITIELLSNAESSVEALERGEIDFLIAPQQYISQNHPAEDLFEDGYLCVAWAGNQEIGDSLSLDQYFALGHVAARFGKQRTPAVDEWFFERFGHTRRIEVVAMTFSLLPELVVGTSRIATMPETLARLHANYLPLKLLPPPIQIPRLREQIQWHRYRDVDTALTWLRKLLREVAQSLGRFPAKPDSFNLEPAGAPPAA
jgi:LysR family nod box-dependent transcriptional activator